MAKSYLELKYSYFWNIISIIICLFFIILFGSFIYEVNNSEFPLNNNIWSWIFIVIFISILFWNIQRIFMKKNRNKNYIKINNEEI